MLENINSPSDLKKLNIDELPTLCSEIRSKLLSDVTTYGGHLSSNLGAVELTVALHYVYDDEDKIVWDVGHQSYVHKLITGRYSSFDTLRQKNGISGFPDTLESKYDCFDTGHASTSISAALGIATARDLQGDDYNVIAVVGDGALTGGMTYEALNNINNRRLLVVLNDNKMSIDRNVGTATKNLSKIRVGKYDKRKEKIKKAILHIPLVGKGIYNILRKIKRHTKLRLLHNLYFDNFKIKYVGPLDGNDVKELVYYFSQIKLNVTKPTVVHLLTKKGKGYVEAEENPSKYHGIASENAVLSNTIT
ncbi:MAG: 1-deoxy-D-xylulose-5-phosphate synthase N-terminal domain-containing protein, partial [Clostridia bacterium]